MGNSSEYLDRLKTTGGIERGVKFDLVVSVDFYDGPERGFAFYLSGEALSFSAIAESKYPIFRAFAFALVDGNRARMVRDALATSGGLPSYMVFASKTDSAISALLDSVYQASEKAYYVGVGRAYLDGVAVTGISKTDLDNLTSTRNVDYPTIHRYIKEVENRTMRS
jgi:hypothetical protein